MVVTTGGTIVLVVTSVLLGDVSAIYSSAREFAEHDDQKGRVICSTSGAGEDIHGGSWKRVGTGRGRDCGRDD